MLTRSFVLIPLVGSVAAIAAACNALGTTDATSTTATPIISTEVKDSTAFPASTSVLVRAHVTDAGLPVIGAAVTYAVASGHGRLSATTGTTDSLGVATVTFTLSDSAGVNALAIGAVGVTDTLRLIGVIGEPSSLVAIGGTTATIPIGGSTTLQVKAIDRPGNPVPHTAVNWSASGGTLTATNTATDGSGLSQTTFSATTAGTYLVTAVLPNEASLIFTITVH